VDALRDSFAYILDSHDDGKSNAVLDALLNGVPIERAVLCAGHEPRQQLNAIVPENEVDGSSVSDDSIAMDTPTGTETSVSERSFGAARQQ
jgi:hypothetical protein